MHHRHQERRSINHCGIDYLTHTRTLCFPKRSKQTYEQQHRSATEVTDQVDRRSGRLVAATNMGQNTSDGNVVQVVTGHACEWTFLSPTRQAAVYESGIYFEAIIWAEATPLHDPWPKSLDENVGIST